MAVDLIAMFAQDLELRGMAPGTCATYCRVLRQFSRYFEAMGKPVQDVKKPELKIWLHYLRLERGLKTTSIEVDFAILTSFYDYLLDEEMIEANPVPAFRRRNLHSYKKALRSGEPGNLSLSRKQGNSFIPL